STNFAFEPQQLTWLWDDHRLADFYEEDDMAARIVDALPSEAMRKAWDLRIADDDASIHSATVDYCDRLQVNERMLEARKWARLFGLAAVYLGVDDGTHPSRPLVKKNIRGVHFLQTFE